MLEICRKRQGEWPRYFVGTPAVVKGHLMRCGGELGVGFDC